VKGQIPLSDVVIVEEAESEPLGNRPYAFQVHLLWLGVCCTVKGSSVVI